MKVMNLMLPIYGHFVCILIKVLNFLLHYTVVLH